MAANAAATEEEKKREKQFYLFLVAFGGHKFTMNKLREYLRYDSGAGISHFFYLEYFLHQPLRRDKKKEFVKDGGSVFCPFLERMIKEQPFLLDWGEIEDNLEAGIAKLENVTAELLPRRRDLEKKFLKEPLVIETKSKKLAFGKKLFDNWKKKSGKIGAVDDKYTLDKLKDDLQAILKLDINKRGIRKETKRGLIKELAVLIYPWAISGALNSKNHIDMVGVPIASNKLFYGYILVGFFHKGTKNISAIRKHLKKEMKDQATNFYLPALILCHHSLYEKLYLSQESRFAIIDENVPFCLNSLSGSNNMLERNIHKLWKMRKQKVSNNYFTDKDLKSHFIFENRFWGSPTSIQKIEEALTWDISFVNDRESNRKLKTFLIFGSPGSGKDTLSKMIGLFSSGHTFSEPYIVNMAALKPDWIAPPSLAGMHLQFGNPDKDKDKFLGEQYVLDGIFKKVLDEDASKKTDKDKWPVLIFDELNSLDIDTQGTLLRILENAEIVPIGGIKKAVKTKNAEKLLVVGVVNELPHQLTLEDTLKSFSQNKKLWGSLLGTALYESFRGVRRLRDDLYYRFAKGGYIELPDLDNRREDIPIIFFASLPDRLRNDIVGKKIFVEYDVWDLLTDVTIQWKGNIRQLQAVAHNIAQEVRKKEIEGRGNRDIDVPLVKRVLKKMKLMKKHESEDDPATDY